MNAPHQPPSHGHSHAQGHAHVHAQAHAHAQAPGQAQPAAAQAPASLLMASVAARLAGVAGLLLLLWLAVAWALGEPA